MALCEYCCAAGESTLVTCSGQCQRSFHGACGGLSAVGLAAWEQDPGMYWFCTDCRHELVPKARSASIEINMLPVEMLEQIFLKLEYDLYRSQLLRIREVCRRWKEVFDGSPFLNVKLGIRIKNKILDEHFQPRNLPPAKKLSIRKSIITTVDHWWPFGEGRMVDLRLDDCRLSVSSLHKTLPSTSSLYVVKVTVEDTGALAPDSQLQPHGLRMLSLPCGDMDILAVLCKAQCFPQLRAVNFGMKLKQNSRRMAAAWFDIIRKSQDTLENIVIRRATSDIFEVLSTMPQLCLKRFVLWILRDKMPSGHWNDFFRMQAATLTNLTIHPIVATKTVLDSIGRLYNLRKISVTLRPISSEVVEPSFLKSMQQLQYLDLYTEPKNASLDLRKYGNSQLKRYELRNCHCLGLSEYLGKSTSIRSITLEYCSFDNWEDLFRGIEQLNESLRWLTIEGVDVRNNPAGIYLLKKTFFKLSYLQLTNTESMSKQMQQIFLGVCPQLEEAEFFELGSFDDDVVLKLLLTAGKLHDLEIGLCNITDISAEYLFRYGTNLSSIELDEDAISPHALRLLTDGRTMKVNSDSETITITRE